MFSSVEMILKKWSESGEMSSKKKRNWIGSAISALFGLACVLLLGAVFYGAMAYQLLDQEKNERETAQIQEEARLALPGAQMLSEETVSCEYGGTPCTALVRDYILEEGLRVQAVTARPAAYIQRLSEEKYVPQLVTGFTLAGLDAVYASRGEERLLCARSAETVVMLLAATDEQTLYTLGASAALQ